MSELNDSQGLEMLERVCNAHDAEDQRSLAAWIAGRSVDEQTQWNLLLVETRGTREALSNVAIPPRLEAQLGLIAACPPAWQWRDVLTYRLRNWQIAACLAMIAMVVAYSIWPQDPPPMPTLDKGAVQQIAEFSVGHRSANLQITSSDPATVLALFQSERFSFAVRLPHAASSLTLVGGAVAPLANCPAAMTRWHGANGDFSVYQFDAAALKLPAGFATVQQQLGNEHVLIWPGGDASAWAMVSDGYSPFNPFCGE